MGTSHLNEITLVRRKGAIDTTTYCGNDSRGWRDRDGNFQAYAQETGDRRSRQIARRHWLKRTSSGWSSGGGGINVVTTLPPGKDEHFIQKPRNFGGNFVWLKKSDRKPHIGSLPVK